MGGCVSTPDKGGEERSDEVDKLLREDCEQLKWECKILLLGPLS